MTLDKQSKDDSDPLQEQLRTDLMIVHKITAERLQLSALGRQNKIDHLLSYCANSAVFELHVR